LFPSLSGLYSVTGPLEWVRGRGRTHPQTLGALHNLRGGRATPEYRAPHGWGRMGGPARSRDVGAVLGWRQIPNKWAPKGGPQPGGPVFLRKGAPGQGGGVLLEITVSCDLQKLFSPPFSARTPSGGGVAGGHLAGQDKALGWGGPVFCNPRGGGGRKGKTKNAHRGGGNGGFQAAGFFLFTGFGRGAKNPRVSHRAVRTQNQGVSGGAIGNVGLV